MSDHEEVEMDEQVDASAPTEEPKRGRGRPKRIVTKGDSDQPPSDAPVAKRGRGRPPASASAEKAEKAPKAKKPAAKDAVNGDSEDAGKTTTKRRGRPAKAAAKEKEPEPEPESEEEQSGSEEEEPAPPAKQRNAKAAGKKAAKNGHAKEEEAEDEPEDSDAVSNDSRIKIVVEHCKSCQTYRRKAEDIITALKEKWSNIEVEYNPNPPRKGSFEINLIGNSGKDVKLWTGLDLGPPRKLKFPEPEAVVEAMEKAYVPESA